ncbi:MAG: hypothetical protein ACUVX9_03780 [Anaerolineae bacterium]
MRKVTFLLIGALTLAILVVIGGLPRTALGCAPAHAVPGASSQVLGRPAHLPEHWPQVVSGPGHPPSREGPVIRGWPSWTAAPSAPAGSDGLQSAPAPRQWSQQGEYSSTGPEAGSLFAEVWALCRSRTTPLLIIGLVALALAMGLRPATEEEGVSQTAAGAAGGGGRSYTTLPTVQAKPARRRPEAEITLRGDQVADWERDRLVPK